MPVAMNTGAWITIALAGTFAVSLIVLVPLLPALRRYARIKRM